MSAVDVKDHLPKSVGGLFPGAPGRIRTCDTRFRSSPGGNPMRVDPRTHRLSSAARGRHGPLTLLSAADVRGRSPPRPLLLPKRPLLRLGFGLLAVCFASRCPLTLMQVALAATYDGQPCAPTTVLLRSPTPRLGHLLVSPSPFTTRTLAASRRAPRLGRRTREHSRAHGSGGPVRHKSSRNGQMTSAWP